MKLTAAWILMLAMSISTAAQAADMIIINADVHTVDANAMRTAAVAVANGRILAVGSNNEIKRLATASTNVIDARGRPLLPGFNDSHVHFFALGNTFSSLRPDGIRSADQLLNQIRETVSIIPAGRWILGSGFDKAAIPDLSSLDAAAADHPLLLYLSDGRSAVANKRAFSLAKIDPKLPVAGDELKRLRRAVPAEHTRDGDAILQAASNYAASLGITSVTDLDAEDSLPIYERLAAAGKLKTRVYKCRPIFSAQREHRPDRALSMVRGGCVKAFVEGDEDRQQLTEMRNAVQKEFRSGRRILIHAIGEPANTEALSILNSLASKPADRVRIEHAHRARRSTLWSAIQSRYIFSVQPGLFFSRPGSSTDEYRLILRKGGKLAFGSDAPMASFDPLDGIKAAVIAGGLTVDEAVRAYTAGSAFAEFQENVKGTIARGMAADLIILSDDIFSIDPAMIGDVFVTTTIVDGRVVYEKSEE